MTDTAVPAKGTPEYDAYMISVAEKGGVDVKGAPTTPAEPAPEGQQAAPPEQKPTRPEWVPEKFWDAEKGEVRTEAMAKSYAELEKQRSKQAAPQQPAQTPDGQQQGDQQQPAPSQVPAELFERATKEFSEAKALTAETYDALQKAGIPKETVDAYIEGQQARAELVRSKVFGAAGGEENYGKLTAWAAQNLAPEQIEAFDTAVNSGNLSATMGAVANLKALYDAANGSPPKGRVENGGGSAQAAPPEAFRSGAEMTKAMADPRYKTDPAYRADVARKIEGAARLGVNLFA